MNELPNFKANVTIDGFGETELHFLHQLSPAQDAVPLLFVHGWVGLPFMDGRSLSLHD